MSLFLRYSLNFLLNLLIFVDNIGSVKPEEYGGTQNVFVERCSINEHKCFILRAERSIHKSNILEIVSDVNFREKYNLKDDDNVEVYIN